MYLFSGKLWLPEIERAVGERTGCRRINGLPKNKWPAEEYFLANLLLVILVILYYNILNLKYLYQGENLG